MFPMLIHAIDLAVERTDSEGVYEELRWSMPNVDWNNPYSMARVLVDFKQMCGAFQNPEGVWL